MPGTHILFPIEDAPFAAMAGESWTKGMTGSAGRLQLSGNSRAYLVDSDSLLKVHAPVPCALPAPRCIDGSL